MTTNKATISSPALAQVIEALGEVSRLEIPQRLAIPLQKPHIAHRGKWDLFLKATTRLATHRETLRSKTEFDAQELIRIEQDLLAIADGLAICAAGFENEARRVGPVFHKVCDAATLLHEAHARKAVTAGVS